MSVSAKVTCAAFNSQQDAFALGADDGVRIFHSHPLTLLKGLGRELVGSVKFCSILHRSNIILFVGSGNNAKFPSNVVFVYDDLQKELVFEITVKGGPIVNIKVTFTRLVVIQERRIHIFALNYPDNISLIRTEDMRHNPSGLAALSAEGEKTSDSLMLVYPGFKVGSVQLLNLKTLTEKSSLAPCTIDAHLTEIAQLTINIDGTLLATGSTKGTLVRVFNTRTHGILLECRRGTDQATLHCLQFSPCSSFLAVTSDKGTVHIFAVREGDDAPGRRNLLQQVGLASAKERRSIVSITLEPKVLACGFVKAVKGSLHSYNSLVSICADGTYHRHSFNMEGHSNRESFDYLIQLADEQEFWTRPF